MRERDKNVNNFTLETKKERWREKKLVSTFIFVIFWLRDNNIYYSFVFTSIK